MSDSLNLISTLRSNYTHDLSYPDKIESVEKQFLENCDKLGIEYVGPVPTNTLYNIFKTKEYILEVDEDAFYGIIADPGKGKTTVAMISALYNQLNFNHDLIIFTFDELMLFLVDAAKEMELEENDETYISKYRGYHLIIDETVDLFFSGDTSTKHGKSKTKLITVIRFFNLLVGCCATHFERLNKVLVSRFRFLLKIPDKGTIEYYSPRLTKQIQIDADNKVIYPPYQYREKVGFIPKRQKFIRAYTTRKSQFTKTSIHNIMGELKK